jgi:hypothetical protein
MGRKYTLEEHEKYREEQDERRPKKSRPAGRGRRRKPPAVRGLPTAASRETSRQHGRAFAMRAAGSVSSTPTSGPARRSAGSCIKRSREVSELW